MRVFAYRIDVRIIWPSIQRSKYFLEPVRPKLYFEELLRSVNFEMAASILAKESVSLLQCSVYFCC